MRSSDAIIETANRRLDANDVASFAECVEPGRPFSLEELAAKVRSRLDAPK